MCGYVGSCMPTRHGSKKCIVTENKFDTLHPPWHTIRSRQNEKGGNMEIEELRVAAVMLEKCDWIAAKIEVIKGMGDISKIVIHDDKRSVTTIDGEAAGDLKKIILNVLKTEHCDRLRCLKATEVNMGTRHLICVFCGGEYKIAQYGQWDGYPEGQGAWILDFLSSEENVQRLKDNLSKTRFVSWSKITSQPEPVFRTYSSRDLGYEILWNVAGSHRAEILLSNDLDFACMSLCCEWVYVIDFDTGFFEVYEGLNKEPVENRFSIHIPGEIFKSFAHTYYHVKHVVSFPLADLPTEEDFLKITYSKVEDHDRL